MTTTPFDVASARTELYIFARFRAQPGKEAEVDAVIREVAAPTRAEPGCLGYSACRSSRDERLFFVYSRWVDEAAFEAHAALPHTVRFIERVEGLVDHPPDINRARGFA